MNNENIFKDCKKYTIVPIPALVLSEKNICMFMDSEVVGIFCIPFEHPELGLVCDK